MKHILIAVYDTKAKLYGKPVCAQSTGSAVRSFGDAVNDPQTEYNKHPSDYILYSLGEYDDNTATFTVERPQELAKAINLFDPQDE